MTILAPLIRLSASSLHLAVATVMRVATEGGARMMRGAKEPISRLVIFRLVWDFGGRLFDLFLEPLFGAKKVAPF